MLVRLPRSEGGLLCSGMQRTVAERQVVFSHPTLIFTHNPAGLACVREGIRDRGQVQKARTPAPGREANVS